MAVNLGNENGENYEITDREIGATKLKIFLRKSGGFRVIILDFSQAIARLSK